MNDRPKQDVPADIVNRLLATVRSQFCGDMIGEEWGKHSHFVRRNVIMWPAHFVCNAKGFTIPADRYEKIMRTIFNGIKVHGKTEAVKYWPGYLMKCVQDHWRHHWEEYYEESKASGNLAQAALVALGRLPNRQDGVVQSIAMAHGILATKAKTKRKKHLAEQRLLGF